jgi:hypothetical protein
VTVKGKSITDLVNVKVSTKAMKTSVQHVNPARKSPVVSKQRPAAKLSVFEAELLIAWRTN